MKRKKAFYRKREPAQPATALHAVAAPVKISFTCALVRSPTGLPGATTTAMPSLAMTVAERAAAYSSLSSREAMPMSQVPSIAAVMPEVESLVWISITAAGFNAV